MRSLTITMKYMLTALLLTLSASQLQAQQRSPEKALMVAETFLQQHLKSDVKPRLKRAEHSFEKKMKEYQRRAAARPSRVQKVKNDSNIISRCEPKLAIRPHKTYLNNNIQPFYVFNADNDGFIIISGDERMKTILGYCDSGSFDDAELPEALSELLDYYVAEYEQIQSSPQMLVAADEDAWPAVEPLGKSIWGQGTPFNNKCPVYVVDHFVTGCVATSMAQAMYIYQYPAKGRGQISYTTETLHRDVSFNFGATTFDWANMICDYSEDYDESQGDAVATLMAACGAGVGMNYAMDNSGNFSSGAKHCDVPYSLINHFGYNPNVVYYKRDYFEPSEWLRIMHEELEAGRPLIYGGKNTSGGGGHSFMIDGCDTNGFFHVNWGWMGRYDGYFVIDGLSPGRYSFLSGQDMICHISPNVVGTHESTFYAEDFQPLNDEVQMGNNVDIRLKEVFNFSNSSSDIIPSTTFDGIWGIALYDKDNTFKTILCSEAISFGTLYGRHTKDFSFPTDASIFEDGQEYRLRPFVKANGSNQITLVRTLNAAADEIPVRVVDGQILLGNKDVSYFTRDDIRYHVLEDGNSVEIVSGDNLVGSVTIPSSVSFAGKEYRIITIGQRAFFGNTSLTNIHLPATITTVNDYAFYHCYNLMTLQIDAPLPPETIYLYYPDLFTGITSKAILYVPVGSLSAYQSDPVWGEFESVREGEPEEEFPFAIPEPALSVLESGQTYYIYNMYAHWFLGNGGYYNCQASFSNRPLHAKMTQATKGWRVTFTDQFLWYGQRLYNDGLYYNVIELRQNKDLFWPTEKTNGIDYYVYCDMQTQGHNYWDIEKSDYRANAYKFHIAPSDTWATRQDRGDEVLYATGEIDEEDPMSFYNDEGIVMFSQDGLNDRYNWGFVTQENYEKFVLRQSIYQMMRQLPIDHNATYDGILAAYRSNNSSVDALQQAKIAALDLLCKNAQNDNPMDLTQMIEDYACSSADAWDGVEWNHDSQPDNFVVNPIGYVNSDEEHDQHLDGFFECWTPVANTLPDCSFSQRLTGLPVGRYRLSATVIATHQANGGFVHGASLFVNDGEAIYREACASPYYIERFTLDFVTLSNSFEIGFRTENTDANWVAVDDFKLEYLGYSPEDEIDHWTGVANSMIDGNLPIGDGLFSYPESARERLMNDVRSAQRIAQRVTDVEGVNLAVEMLREGIETFKASMNRPIEGHDYMMVQSRTGLSLSLETENAQLASGTLVHFSPSADGRWVISSSEDSNHQLGYEGTGKAALKTTGETAWSIEPQSDGTYLIRGIYGYVASTSQTIGSKCYGGRLSSAQNTRWIIGEPEVFEPMDPIDGWMTLTLPFAAAVPEGVRVYSCSKVNNDGDPSLILKEENITAFGAMKPYILSDVNEQLSFKGISVANKDQYTVGLLTGLLSDASLDSDSYTFQSRSGVLGFYRGAHRSKALSVYMKHNTLTADCYKLPNPDGIHSPLQQSVTIDVFTLDGRCLTRQAKSVDDLQLTPGIYIVNGKKVVVQ